MKKAFTLIICVVALLVSCKKDKNQAPVYYITADIDGAPVSFTSNNLSRLTAGTNGGSLATNSELYLYGAAGLDENSDAISIMVSEPQTIGTGTYRGGADDSRSISIQYLTGPFTTNGSNEYVSDLSDAGMSVTVTSVDAKTVQGTFKGVLYHNGAQKAITNGKFNLMFNY